jgi:hypothetical protein
VQDDVEDHAHRPHITFRVENALFHAFWALVRVVRHLSSDFRPRGLAYIAEAADLQHVVFEQES